MTETKSISTTVVYSQLERAVRQGFTLVSEQGSARSGKTYNTMLWLVLYALRNADLVSIVRKTLPALKGSVLRDFREIIESLGIAEDIEENKSDLTYRFPGGGEMEFFSSDNEAKLRGRKRRVLFVNEANELTYLEYQQLKMRTEKLTIIDYNPSFGEGHWINAANKDARTFHFVTTYRDNPFCPPEVVREIESLKDRDKNLWQIYGMGERAEVEGAVYSHKMVKSVPEGLRTAYGLDFGFTHDPTALVRVGIDTGRREIYIEEVIYRTGMVNSEIAEEMTAAGIAKRRDVIFADSASPKDIQELCNLGFVVKPSDKVASVVSQINRIRGFAVYVTEDSSSIRREMGLYVYAKDKEGNWLNEPVDAFNHGLDAMRYAVTGILGRATGYGSYNVR